MSDRSPVVHSQDRWLMAVALVATGAAHLPLVREHLEEVPYMGRLFLGLAVACLVLAVVVVVHDSPVVWALGGATTGATLVGYLLSRTVGLPGLGDDVGSWAEPVSFPAVTAELIAVALACWVLASRGTSRSASRGASRGGSAVPVEGGQTLQ